MYTTLPQVWNQKSIPVVLRDREGPLKVRLPYRADNRRILASCGRKSPVWSTVDKHWELPRSWFSSLITKLLDVYGSAYAVQPHRAREVCAPACWNAFGLECECSCLGRNHGSHHGFGWHVISEACAVRWAGETIAIQHYVKPKSDPKLQKQDNGFVVDNDDFDDDDDDDETDWKCRYCGDTRLDHIYDHEDEVCFACGLP